MDGHPVRRAPVPDVGPLVEAAREPRRPHVQVADALGVRMVELDARGGGVPVEGSPSIRVAIASKVLPPRTSRISVTSCSGRTVTFPVASARGRWLWSTLFSAPELMPCGTSATEMDLRRVSAMTAESSPA
ncbi:hypothetical protein ACFYVR_19600 [Rhodococcus sp. NPDC003318]|uniref:hypothetical protein n=1 Tax=Rhodococcus sp. NPDC003318 TaxID=3364503 RepID=UPI00369EABF0